MGQDSEHQVVQIAALQPALAFGHPKVNRANLRDIVAKVVCESATDWVVLPEIYDGDVAVSDGDRDRSYLSEIARDYGVRVVGGSCFVADDGGQFNACYVFDHNGDLLGRYDKRILFASESSLRTAGQQAGVFEVAGVRVGVLICADLWYPELSRELLNRVDWLAVPVKSSVPTDQHVPYARRLWHAMALTRAMENGLAVAVADWSEARHEREPASGGGKTRQVHFTSGATTVVDPSHRPQIDRIQSTLPDGQPGVLRLKLDLGALAQYRQYRRRVGLLPGDAGPPVVQM